MSKLQLLKIAVTQTAGRTMLITRKFAPEILVGTGIVGVIASTVMACNATTKAEAIMEEAKEKLNTIHTVHATVTAEKYSEKDYQQDLLTIYLKTGGKFVKTYGPAITLGLVSITCILGGYNIMRKRNVALMAAYKAVEGSFAKYRKRVVEEFGAEKDLEFKTGVRKTTLKAVEIDENGNEKVTEKTINVVDPNAISEYSKFFNKKSSSMWSPIEDYNVTFLKLQERIFNDQLQAKGHVFLNEVYEQLGFEHTPAGAVTGWVRGNGDNYIDFGIFNVRTYENATNERKEEIEDFINGYNDSILLDFNVDGLIWDKI